MTRRGVFDALIKCMKYNLPQEQRAIPASYISYNSTMHTFVDGDDRMGDEPNMHTGGNFGFVICVW